jgi:2-C-methyl-D-erythritol 4-phosphate cytidylyltransferase
MALKKVIEWKGINVEYWRIDTLTANFRNGMVIVALAVYKDQATRNADVTNLVKRAVRSIKGADLRREDVYPLLKQSIMVDGEETNVLVDAEDC